MSDLPRYYSAAVCRRGHVETQQIELTTPGDIATGCAHCGQKVLRACPSCDKPIRGAASGDWRTEYVPPDYCVHCLSPFPWVSRQGQIYQLMNLLDEEELDPATELEVREQLEALTNPDLDDEKAERRWKRVKDKAPTLWEKSGAQRILETVVTTAIKRQLDLQ